PGGGHRRGRGAARRPQGAGRAPDAGGPGAQRPRAGVRAGHRGRGGVHGDQAVQPHHAHVLHGDRHGARRRLRGGRAHRHLPRGDPLRGAQDAGDRADRRAGARPARHLRWHGRLLRPGRRPGHGDRDPHGGDQRGPRERAGRWGTGGGLRPGVGVLGEPEQGSRRGPRGPAGGDRAGGRVSRAAHGTGRDTADRTRPRRRLSRRAAVLAVLGGGALLLASTALPWVTAPVRSAVQTSTVSASGSAAAALVPSAALVVLAAGLAIALAGRIARVVAAAAVALGGVLAVFGVIELLRSPGAAVLAVARRNPAGSELDGAAQLTP